MIKTEITDKLKDDVLKSPKPIKVFSRSLHKDIMLLKAEYQLKTQEEVLRFLVDYYKQDMKGYENV